MPELQEPMNAWFHWLAGCLRDIDRRSPSDTCGSISPIASIFLLVGRVPIGTGVNGRRARLRGELHIRCDGGKNTP
jgi:hypothetical protein